MSNNYKYEEIDKFLKLLCDDIKESNDSAFLNSYKSIYNKLIKLGVDSSDLDDKFMYGEICFNIAIDFMSKENIVCKSDGYFLWFANRQDEMLNTSENIKMYFPQNIDHMEKSAKLIFGFLAENNMAHQSKIASDSRFDNIVVRMVDLDEVEKLREFVNNNQYIKEGMINPNPFGFIDSDNIVSVCDGDQSYNRVVSLYINSYLKEKVENNKLDNVSTSDFISFIYDFYKDKNKVDNIISLLDDDIDDYDYLDFKNITRLILMSFDENFDMEDFSKYYQECKMEKDLLRYWDDVVTSYDVNYSEAFYSYMRPFIENNDLSNIDLLSEKVKYNILHSKLRDNVLEKLNNNNISLADYLGFIENKIHDFNMDILFNIDDININELEKIGRVKFLDRNKPDLLEMLNEDDKSFDSGKVKG